MAQYLPANYRGNEMDVLLWFGLLAAVGLGLWIAGIIDFGFEETADDDPF